ncbi:MAG: hypothetical protein HY422_03065 [Candidatus Komeilibacteria bacterium]|nr:hypothetical protein [Candidatus Komeilibacteria bacterium]
MAKNHFEEPPSIPLDRSGMPQPGDARWQEQMTMENVPDLECTHHPGEITYTQVAENGEIIYSCRKTGQRVYDQDAIE